MVIRDGLVKITDFGIARMASSTVLTQTGVVLGSPKYMSPEQVLGKSIDQRSDIFSLGVMLYEMLTGQPPFVGNTINAVMFQTMNTVPPPPSTLNSKVPAMLNFIVAKALAKGLDDRYQNAREFVDDLRACSDALARSGVKAEAAIQPAALNAQIPGAIPVAARIEFDAEETRPVANMGLSSNFDSYEATMRLAAMTAPEDIEEIGKTLRMARPNPSTINHAVPQAAKLRDVAPVTITRTIVLHANKANGASPRSANSGKLLLLLIVLLALLGLILFL
jgi:serine/threonine-protein kinase